MTLIPPDISMLRGLAAIAAASMLAACAVPAANIVPPTQASPTSAYEAIDARLARDYPRAREALPAPPDAMSRGSLATVDELSQSQPRLYSFHARGLEIRDALAIFARANDLNLVADPDLTGTVTVDFENVPLASAFEVLLSSLGYSWESRGGVLRVKSTVTRTFELDYIRGSRSSNTTATASGTGGVNGGSVGASAGLSDSITFWQEFEQQVKSMLSPRGRIIINRLTGTVMVTDSAPKVEAVEGFIGMLKDGMTRQVDIEVRIVEVTLSDDFSLGLDWSRLNIKGKGNIDFSTLIAGPQGVSPKPSTMTATYSSDRYTALIQALKEQGDVRMVSQPRVRILNNQTAFVKVGTTDTFYTRTNNRTTQQGVGVIESINEQPTAVNLGVMLTVTPQISADGWTMLNVAPTVTRLSGTTTSPSGQSTAPVLDVKEATTLVRVRSGELVVLGGLIEEEGTRSTRAVPLLGEIPTPVNPFRGDYRSSRRKELVIFLMPTVIAGR